MVDQGGLRPFELIQIYCRRIATSHRRMTVILLC